MTGVRVNVKLGAVMPTECGANLLTRLRRYRGILAAEVEHDWASDRHRLVQKILHPGAVVPHPCIKTETRRREARQPSSHAVPHRADCPGERRPPFEPRDRRAD